MKRILVAIIIIVTFWGNYNSYAQLRLYPGQTAELLAKTLAGPGIQVLNPVLTCANRANGIFASTNTIIGLDSGIVLTTGSVNDNMGAYGLKNPQSVLASSENGYPGDSSLNYLSLQKTVDACKLEFDFIPDGDSISVDYIFSSEEYKSAVCGPYNDAFAFFISGSDIIGADNMALVPGTNIPVTINSINNGIPGITGNIVNCTNMGAGSPFTTYYIDNSTGTQLSHFGLTKVLTASHSVSRCNTYHLKLVIADAGNPKYDSGVFLEANSLRSDNYTIQAISTVPALPDTTGICIKGCYPGKLKIKRSTTKSYNEVVHFIKTGTAVEGIDYVPFPDSILIPAFSSFAEINVTGLATSPLGKKYLQLKVYSPISCQPNLIVDSVTLTIYDTINFTVFPSDTFICKNVSFNTYAVGDSIYNYTWQPSQNLTPNSQSNVDINVTQDLTYKITATVNGVGCLGSTRYLTIKTRNTPEVFINPDTTACAGRTINMYPYIIPNGPTYSYEWTKRNNIINTSNYFTLSNLSQKDSSSYTLEVTNDTNGCKAKSSFNVNVITVKEPEINSLNQFCLSATYAPLYVVGQEIKWYDINKVYIGDIPPEINTSQLNENQYFVSNNIGYCESSLKPITIEVVKCCDGEIVLPNAFTPNNDGINDYFRILKSSGYTLKKVEIFNRWGNIVYGGSTLNWDGMDGNNPAPGGTYFYNIYFGCVLGGEANFHGDVILIR